MMVLVFVFGRRIVTMFGLMILLPITHDSRPIKMLTVIDEYSRECLAIVTERNLKSDDVLDCLTEMFIRHGAPGVYSLG